jgi:hypothetical protein
MKRICLCAGMMVLTAFGASAQGRPGQCVDSFRYQWGYDASTNGRVQSGGSCRTSFSYGGATTTGYRVVSGPANGRLDVGQVGDGRLSILYTSRRGFAGIDVFVVEIRGSAVDRSGNRGPERTTKVTYAFRVTP